MEIGIDVIGDLFLSPDDEFDWSGKPTSLYCIVTGNVSNDMVKLYEVLENISDCYKGLFYVSGSYEFENCKDIRKRTDEINYICKQINNVASLWHHVVLMENIAILGCNGWTRDDKFMNHPDSFTAVECKYEDVIYLKNSVSKLQKHGDVRSMIVVTNSVPSIETYFGEEPDYFKEQINLNSCLKIDTEHKVKHWVYGTYGKTVSYNSNGILYTSNPYIDQPYWPKRIIAEI